MGAVRGVLRFLGYYLVASVIATFAFLIVGQGGSSAAVAPVAVMLIGATAGIWGVWRHSNDRGISKARAAAMVDEAHAWLEQAEKTGKLSPPDTGAVIVPIGQVALLSEPSSLAEFQSDGGRSYLGTRVKVGQVPLYLGQSQRNARKVLQNIATGQLVLTDAGLLFVSTGKTVAIKLRDVVGVEATADSIVVNAANRVNPLMASVRNPVLWSLAIRLLAEGKLSATP